MASIKMILRMIAVTVLKILNDGRLYAVRNGIFLVFFLFIKSMYRNELMTKSITDVIYFVMTDK